MASEKEYQQRLRPEPGKNITENNTAIPAEEHSSISYGTQSFFTNNYITTPFIRPVDSIRFLLVMSFNEYISPVSLF